MQIGVGYKLTYNLPQSTPMLLTVNIHYSRTSDLVMPDHLVTVPAVPVTGYRDLFGNWISRIVAPAGQICLSGYAIVRDIGRPDGSPLGWGRVQAICDYVHNHLEFSYEHARPTKTAWEAYQEGNGVCRDFAHLAVAFCRCMNIPARYCTGYLGDIGVPAMDAPMDFSGWFEAYLGGQWHVFDARFNTPRIGRVLMAHGRDAADVAIVTTFGPNTLTGFEVAANEIVP